MRLGQILCLSLFGFRDAFKIPKYQWEELDFRGMINVSGIIRDPGALRGIEGAAMANGQPVYVSMTTIHSRIKDVYKHIMDILKGSAYPTRIYLFISSKPFILDRGIRKKDIPRDLMKLTLLYPVSIVLTDNLGPHRKLLPLLARKWNEDCVIVTFDDEPKRNMGEYLPQLLRYYVASNREAVVSLKARRLSFCDTHPFKLLPYKYWGDVQHSSKEMLALPTGTGGILYRPRFFHSIVFDEALRNMTYVGDDLLFRFATWTKGIYTVTGNRDRGIRAGDTRMGELAPLLGSGGGGGKEFIIRSKLSIQYRNYSGCAASTSQRPRSCVPSSRKSKTPTNHLSSGKSTDKNVVYGNKTVEVKVGKGSSSIESDGTKTDAALGDVEVDESRGWNGRRRRLSVGFKDGDGARRRLGSSLYGVFNSRRGMNDIALRKVIAYLKKSNLFDFKAMVPLWIRSERSGCFLKLSNISGPRVLASGTDAGSASSPLLPYPVIVPFPGHECCMRLCDENNPALKSKSVRGVVAAAGPNVDNNTVDTDTQKPVVVELVSKEEKDELERQHDSENE